jgi:hypothetical protein
LGNWAKGLDPSPFSQLWQWVEEYFLDYFDEREVRNWNHGQKAKPPILTVFSGPAVF